MIVQKDPKDKDTELESLSFGSFCMTLKTQKTLKALRKSIVWKTSHWDLQSVDLLERYFFGRKRSMHY